MIAENDFMANAGDGYPNFSDRMTSQDIMEQVVADYITANTPIAPKVLGGAAGRITCQDADPDAGPNCPTRFHLPDVPRPGSAGPTNGLAPRG